MINFVKKIKSLPDKKKHLIVGFVFGFTFFPISLILDINISFFINLIISSLVFILKEIYDKYKKKSTGFDFIDLFADYLGWCVGIWIAACFIILYHYLFIS